MLRYILNRILLIIPTLIVVIFLIFFILNIVPGDPARIILGQDASAEAVAELNHELGMDRPMLERFFRYLLDAVRLDFGESYRSREPVFDEILAKFPTTLMLSLLAIVGMSVIGIPLGIISAVKQYSVLDYSLTVSSLILASMPGFFLALMLILIFSLKLGLLPSMGADTARHYVLPVLALSLTYIAPMRIIWSLVTVTTSSLLIDFVKSAHRREKRANA